MYLMVRMWITVFALFALVGAPIAWGNAHPQHVINPVAASDLSHHPSDVAKSHHSHNQTQNDGSQECCALGTATCGQVAVDYPATGGFEVTESQAKFQAFGVSRLDDHFPPVLDQPPRYS